HVQRHRIVNLRANLPCGEKGAQTVAAWSADDVLMPDVPVPGRFLGQDDAMGRAGFNLGQSGAGKKLVVPRSDGPARLIPVLDVFELDVQNGRLEPVQARIPAELVVI